MIYKKIRLDMTDENAYIEAMDFEKSGKIADELIERIWKSEWWSEQFCCAK